MILKFQRKNLLETSSSSCDSDNNNKFDSIKLMESKNPMIRLVIFGKLKRMINSYRKNDLEIIDRRLLRGLFIRNLKDFDEDYNEKVSNKSLLARLKLAMQLSQNSIDDPEMLAAEISKMTKFDDSRAIMNYPSGYQSGYHKNQQHQ